MKKLLSAIIVALIIINPATVSASEINSAIVDTVVQDGTVTIEQGTNVDVNVLFTVTGHQDGYATFKYISVWSVADGTLVPVETASVTTPPKAAGTTLDYYRTVSILTDNNQPAGSYSLRITPFDIVNSNQTGAKLNLGNAAVYELAVEESNDNTSVPEPPAPEPQDVTAPVVTFGDATPAANSNGWNNTPVSVLFTVADDLSGVKAVTPADRLNFDQEGAGQTQTVLAVDHAGNEASYTSQNVNIDMTAPVVTALTDSLPNANGWYNKDVTVSFTAEDTLSGVDTTEPAKRITSEGADIKVTGDALDLAGNTGSTEITLNLDKTAPKLTISGITDGSVYKLNQSQNVTWTAEDTLSGIDTASSSLIAGKSLDTSSVGTKTLSFAAKDKAGNITTLTINYKVVYSFSGILQPVNSDGSSIFKQGSTVPVKFALTDAAGNYISAAAAKLYYAKLSDNVSGNVLEALSTSAATSGNLFRYDSTSNQYIFNLNTKGLAVGTYNLSISLDDGMTYQVKVSLR